MNGAEDDEVKNRAVLAAWLPATILVGLLILLLVGWLVLG